MPDDLPRRFARKTVSIRAWIRAPGVFERCLMVDVSQAGAKLMVTNPASLPTEFELLLSETAVSSKKCSIRWQAKDCVGIHFLTRDLISRAPTPRPSADEKRPGMRDRASHARQAYPSAPHVSADS